MAQQALLSLPEFQNVSTGSLVVKEPLNFWGGARVKPKHTKNSEAVFEPATGMIVVFLVYLTVVHLFSFCAFFIV